MHQNLPEPNIVLCGDFCQSKMMTHYCRNLTTPALLGEEAGSKKHPWQVKVANV
ncbi:hypothetical protein D1AOALGA4SA_4200 [Olavius algarvensis Delta 1 endosymbiont]|nr:hypothetical protein D1AOALGA4SA_4200 [Olavius algarvensis Delta 1 endosymbiont]